MAVIFLEEQTAIQSVFCPLGFFQLAIFSRETHMSSWETSSFESWAAVSLFMHPFSWKPFCPSPSACHVPRSLFTSAGLKSKGANIHCGQSLGAVLEGNQRENLVFLGWGALKNRSSCWLHLKTNKKSSEHPRPARSSPSIHDFGCAAK